MRKRWAWAAIGVVSVLGIVAYMWATSMRAPSNVIERRLLRATPMGSSMAAVAGYASRRGWTVEVDTTRGFLDQRDGPVTLRGAQSMRAIVAEYRGLPWLVSVTVHWAFDDDGELIDIWVWKVADAL